MKHRRLWRTQRHPLDDIDSVAVDLYVFEACRNSPDRRASTWTTGIKVFGLDHIDFSFQLGMPGDLQRHHQYLDVRGAHPSVQMAQSLDHHPAQADEFSNSRLTDQCDQWTGSLRIRTFRRLMRDPSSVSLAGTSPGVIIRSDDISSKSPYPLTSRRVTLLAGQDIVGSDVTDWSELRRSAERAVGKVG